MQGQTVILLPCYAKPRCVVVRAMSCSLLFSSGIAESLFKSEDHLLVDLLVGLSVDANFTRLHRSILNQ